jgi:hypothetical protein
MESDGLVEQGQFPEVTPTGNNISSAHPKELIIVKRIE